MVKWSFTLKYLFSVMGVQASILNLNQFTTACDVHIIISHEKQHFFIFKYLTGITSVFRKLVFMLHFKHVLVTETKISS